MLKLPYERQKVEDDALPLQVVPGYLSVLTPNEAQGRWKDGNMVRFVPGSGFAGKIGGWVDLSAPSNLPNGVLGACRQTKDWQSLDRQQWTAIGTNSKLYVYNQGIFYDVTPMRSVDSLTNPFTTTNTSAVVTVTDIAHGAFNGDYVTFAGFSPFNGVTIVGQYQISNVTVNTYTITAANTATSSGAGGSNGTATYDINSMASDTALVYGWGTGSWGAGTWGTPRNGSAGQVSNIYSNLGFWSLDNWGEDLIASPVGGSIYIWKHSTGPYTRASLISINAPRFNNRVLVAEQQRQIICFGTSVLDSSNAPTGEVDPSLIAWCASEDYTTWFPSVTVNAGTLRINAGSGIVIAQKTRGGIFVATTTNGNLFQQTGDVNVYATVPLGQTTRPCGPNAGTDYNGTFYMMGIDNFFIYNGTLQTMPCDVWNQVFSKDGTTPGFNRAQSNKVVCHAERSFNEIWWHYPSAASNENDRYVVYNFALNCWHYGLWSANAGGDINRSWGHDYSDQLSSPYMFWFDGANSHMYQHETGYLANGSANFGEYIESWDVDVMQSGQLINVHHMIPNFKFFGGGTISVTVKCRKYPTDAYKIKGPYTITPTTQKISARAKGRQLAMRVYGSTAGWIMGTWRNACGEDGDR